MKKNILHMGIQDLSDNIIKQATCSVLIKDKPVGTAFLISRKGHVLSAGHLVEKIKKVKIQFSEDVPRIAHRIQKVYDHEAGVDFAVLLIEDMPRNRTPLRLKLVTSLSIGGKFRFYGYGKTLKYMASGAGEISGSYDPQNNTSNTLFRLRSQELEGGYSGAAVVCNYLQAVVAIQTQAASASTGPARDTAVAMPLYRIAKYWNELATNLSRDRK